MLLPQEIIARKRDNHVLTKGEIGNFVDGLVSQKFNDAQVGAMAMAIFQQGLSQLMALLLINTLLVVLVIKSALCLRQ
jgi:thymidine phosphorylase